VAVYGVPATIEDRCRSRRPRRPSRSPVKKSAVRARGRKFAPRVWATSRPDRPRTEIVPSSLWKRAVADRAAGSEKRQRGRERPMKRRLSRACETSWVCERARCPGECASRRRAWPTSSTHAPRPRQGFSRNDWTAMRFGAVFDLPLPELIFRAQLGTCGASIRRSCRSRRCCDQRRAVSGGLRILSASARTIRRGKLHRLLDVGHRRSAARDAKKPGARASCMGAHGVLRAIRDVEKVCELGRSRQRRRLETCVTLGC